MANLLIVDDEFRIRELIKKYAIYEGHSVTEASTGDDAIAFCNNCNFDLIILDIMMPGTDGFTTAKIIREKKQTPIIMLSARGEEYDKIKGFEMGIDDYVVKPFSPKELMMRINAVLKRSSKESSKNNDVFSCKGLKVDFTSRIVSIDKERVELTPKEFDLLYYMIKNKDIALTRETLISKVWGYDFYGDDRTLDTHIKLLRKSLGPYSKFIVTLRGVGYRFETEEN